MTQNDCGCSARRPASDPTCLARSCGSPGPAGGRARHLPTATSRARPCPVLRAPLPVEVRAGAGAGAGGGASRGRSRAAAAPAPLPPPLPHSFVLARGSWRRRGPAAPPTSRRRVSGAGPGRGEGTLECARLAGGDPRRARASSGRASGAADTFVPESAESRSPAAPCAPGRETLPVSQPGPGLGEDGRMEGPPGLSGPAEPLLLV